MNRRVLGRPQCVSEWTSVIAVRLPDGPIDRRVPSSVRMVSGSASDRASAAGGGPGRTCGALHSDLSLWHCECVLTRCVQEECGDQRTRCCDVSVRVCCRSVVTCLSPFNPVLSSGFSRRISRIWRLVHSKSAQLIAWSARICRPSAAVLEAHATSTNGSRCCTHRRTAPLPPPRTDAEHTDAHSHTLTR